MFTFNRVRVKLPSRCHTIKQRAMVCNNFWKLKEEKGDCTSGNLLTIIQEMDIFDTERRIVYTSLLLDLIYAAEKLCLIPIIFNIH